LYRQAPALLAQGVRVVSTDEKTGMQARERARPTLPMKPGLPERREVEYVRHGTLCLTANLEVATGRVLAPTVAVTRTDADFAAHVAGTVAIAPEAGWVFVLDNLNTHMSEDLVRFVAGACGIEDDLGRKERRGVLKTMASRAAFLSDPTHRIRCHYTPKHCSWLNQVELFFSVIARRLLRRGSFLSLDDLKRRVLAFIKLYNERWAKPYRWTHTGRPLQP
jgi:transposase